MRVRWGKTREKPAKFTAMHPKKRNAWRTGAKNS